ncbi:MAG: peptide ABC transporter substrate-binding protein [Oscillospiraceae bacterium]|nr:peptide ABC transporter substrate-binding protein [Oscillospiraceae bacterium]
MRRVIRLLALGLALALALTACGAQETAPGLTLRIAMADSPATLDPALVSTDTEKTLAGHLFENLMKLTPEGVMPAMCRSYEVTDNLDGTETYTFALRDGVTWSDGRAVTAGDFVFAWQRLADPETGSPNAALLDMVAGYEEARSGDVHALQVSAADEHTLVVALNCHCPYFLSTICTAAATCPVRADVVSQSGWDMNLASITTNGPYVLSRRTADGVELTAAEGYYDAGRMGVTTLRFTYNVDTAAAMAQYEAGELDVVMDAAAHDDAVLSYLPQTTVLLANQMAGSVRNETLRRCLSAVIDRNALAALAGEGCMAVGGIVPRGTVATQGGAFRDLSTDPIDNTPENYETIAAAAVTELAESGALSTISETENGMISLVYESGNEEVAKALQQVWKDKLGVRVLLRGMDSESLAAALARGEFALALTDLTSDRNDALGFLGRFSTGAEGNFGSYHSGAYDLLMRCAAAAKSAEARDAYLVDAEDLLIDSGYVMPLYGATHYWLVRPNLTGALDNGQDTHYFTYVREIPAA